MRRRETEGRANSRLETEVSPRGGALFEEPIFGAAMRFCFRDPDSLEGMRVLDLGCGSGSVSAYMALHGAHVVAVDVDRDRVRRTAEVAHSFGVGDRVCGVVGAAEQLPFGPAAFDLVFSRSTFQYLDIDSTISEVERVLRDGGSVFSIQNLPDNPFLRLYRVLRRQGARTDEEIQYVASIRRYVSRADVGRLSRSFSRRRSRTYHLFRPLTMADPSGRSRRGLARIGEVLGTIDDALLRRLPFLGRYAWIEALALDGFRREQPDHD